MLNCDITIIYIFFFYISSVSESLSTVSVNDPSVLGEDVWEPGYSTLSMCQKFQKEFTKKMEARHFIYNISCVCSYMCI